MKKLYSSFAGFIFLFLSFNAIAQTPPVNDYFIGKWNVLVVGTPQGDGKLTVYLERKDGKLSGYQYSTEKQDTMKFTRVEEKDKSVTAYFTTQGFDVTMTLIKKDDDHVTGNVMDMFEATGERIRQTGSKQ